METVEEETPTRARKREEQFFGPKVIEVPFGEFTPMLRKTVEDHRKRLLYIGLHEVLCSEIGERLL